MLAHLDLLLPSLFDALHAPSERVVVEALSVQAAIAADDSQQFRTLMQELIDRCADVWYFGMPQMGAMKFLSTIRFVKCSIRMIGHADGREREVLNMAFA